MIVPQDPASLAAAFARDVREGLRARPKRLPPRWFYDASGSALFEAITHLPEYYLTEAELSIIEREAPAIVASVPKRTELVEFGAGSGRKTREIIAAFLAREPELLYCPIDISRDALESAAVLLEREFRGLRVKTVVAEYGEGLRARAADGGPRLVLFLGSSIGNFERDRAAEFLATISSRLGPDDRLLLGTDLHKETATLEAAYNDPAGITAAFNLNILARINRELGGAFDLERFHHRAHYNVDERRIEMHLESDRAHEVAIGGLKTTVRFEAGETIHTENSYKFTGADLDILVSRANLSVDRSWTDARGLFGLHLLRRRLG